MPLVDFYQHHYELCQALLRIRRGGRAGHAYLFIADDRDLAESLARAWLQGFACRRPGTDGDACGECDHCRQFMASSYPHLHVLQPVSKSRQIVIDDIRGFERHLHLTAAGGIFKAGLVIEADRLNDQAQNALLKTLEEPPRNTIIVLLTVHPRELLPTIRSRCQTVSLLKNLRSYQVAGDKGLFPILASMRPGSGVRRALPAAVKLQALFAGLQREAQEMVAVEAGREEMDQAEIIDQDEQLRKRVKELQAARVAAEYRGLRNQLTEAVHCWYLQQVLVVEGVSREHLPHPEFYSHHTEAALSETDREACEKAVMAAERLQRQLNGNMDEKLAIQAFCLELCEKS